MADFHFHIFVLWDFETPLIDMSNPFHADRRICGQGYSCPVVEAMKGSPRTTSVFMAKSSTPSSNFDAAIFGHNLFLATCSRMGAPFGKLSSRSSAAPSPEVIDSGLAGCSQCKRVTGILGSSGAVPTNESRSLTATWRLSAATTAS